jgi:type IV secretory pathway VirB10-like protein
MDKMTLDQKILNEISRYNSINKYITEQEVPAPPVDPTADPAAIPPPTPEDTGAPIADPAAPTPPVAPEGGEAEAVDVANDPDVEEISGEGEEGEEGTEELDITDLVDSQKTMADKQEEYFTNLFDQIKKMEEKLSEMDGIVSKLDTLETKVEKYRPKTAQEKLELRSLDSGPFKQNLADFFKDKEDEMEKTGKNEYVLTQGDVENFSPSEIEKTFNQPMEDEDDILLNKYNS